MADTNKDAQPKGSKIFPSRSKSKTSIESTPSAARQWISPTAAQTQPVAKKSIIARQLEDEIALDKYSKESISPERKAHHNLIIGISIVVILVFIFTLGGNLVDLATGGDGSHSWYGKNGVYNRFMSGDEASNRANSDSDKNLAESLKNNRQVISNAAPSTAKSHSEIRLLNPPKSEVAAKPLPAQSYQVADFLSSDLKVHCRISDVVECTILKFAGQLGQNADHTVSIILGPNGVQTPKDLGIEASLTGKYSLSAGATATSGNYACTATSGSSIDCWNLKTGKGMVVSQNSAEGYNTTYKFTDKR